MAHFGSCVAASVKVCSDSLYWNECSSARPFSSVGCTSPEQIVGKFTLPSWSGGAANKLVARNRQRQTRANGGMAALASRLARMERPPSGWRTILHGRLDTDEQQGTPLPLQGVKKRRIMAI